MNESEPSKDGRKVAALQEELTEVREETTAARADLEQIQHEVEEARGELIDARNAALLEANAQLVAAAHRAQAAASSCEEALKEVSRAAEIDTLTELPNRTVLLDRLVTAIAYAKRDGTRLALLFLDLDNFKSINDTLGHAAGDEALKITALCLRSSVREADTVSRYGGDEFLILLSEIAEVTDAVLVADKVIAALDASALAGEHSFRLTGSVGISLYPEHGDDADGLIGRADAAMYEAKRNGHRRSVFEG
ncbi:MAG: GGDEF domain-containing protein [Vicinamibacteria bacterium]|jgi:diguanylate cyclase (GGDEF)-like protein|nr:GGDEF domain-containing protein [Vicinamibacteria bacterium]MBP9947698.1 GGDEF domain-containing protein [Vicinamibacteria bacterium]